MSHAEARSRRRPKRGLTPPREPVRSIRPCSRVSMLYWLLLVGCDAPIMLPSPVSPLRSRQKDQGESHE
jgi:hypothetical protein